MDVNALTDDEIIALVEQNPNAGKVEVSLANRLEMKTVANLILEERLESIKIIATPEDELELIENLVNNLPQLK